MPPLNWQKGADGKALPYLDKVIVTAGWDDAARLAALIGNEADLLAAVEKGCKANDRRAARRALLHWIHGYGPTQGRASLLEFAAGMDDPEIRESLQALDSEGFRPLSANAAGAAWNGPAFWKLFDGWRRGWMAAEAGRRAPVTDLYARENRQRA